ncbi:alpha-hydroxy acid oxidase [Neptunomonas phycophila]|uniref:Alpha-hydroxy acid oxidase n=1 Tax=Neptunomonas phycophila TaxID=1572645 RepID=A0ABT9EY05_9GAMM|nr:alpha-hydroxy acid oxidase [Neptunomonas phycophila]MDP2523935.1 alpha-hydroxy acid oxidase [Neptunomonas phycophila]
MFDGNLSKIFCLDDFEEAARRHLPKPLFGYVSGATETNLSLRNNQTSFQQWSWVPHVLRDVSKRDTSIKLFGQTFSAPFGIAPMGISALTAYRGDLQLTNAAKDHNIPMIMSSSSLIPMEEVAAQSDQAWFQAYLPKEKTDAVALTHRVNQAGFKAIIVTVDSAVVPNRENNLRNRFKTPLEPDWRLLWDGVTHPRWAVGTLLRTIVKQGMPHFENVNAQRGAALIAKHVNRDFSGREHLDWEMITTIRRNWEKPLILKGILNVEDALTAKKLGIDGIIISNHGGRQLDGAISPIHVLERIKNAVGGSMVVMIDSGFRRGTDILKAMALGADCAFIGRPFNYAAAIGGYDGVAHAIQLLKSELHTDLGLLGVNTPQELNKKYIEQI